MTDSMPDIVSADEWGLFEDSPLKVISGPCSAESEEQVMQTARQLKEAGIKVFRAGIWKPRTYPGSFEGVGAAGLEWLKKVQAEYGLKVATEVACERHVRECLAAGIDLLWIGARTTANPFLVQEIADALVGTDAIVLVKNPVNPDPDLWAGAVERIHRAGIRKLGIIHRGFSTVDRKVYRNDPLWSMAIEMHSRFPDLPFFVDPSHIAGRAEYVREIAQRSLDLGFEGLMIESHCNPAAALSDAEQQLTPSQLGEMLSCGLVVRSKDSDSPQWKNNIHELRARIDILDEEILRMLSSRMEVSRQIGRYKKENNVAILQTSRWDEVLASVLEKGRAQGLSESFIKDIFNTIHEESVEAQNRILSGPSSGRQ